MVEVTHDLVALHATDPATVYLAAAARLRAPEVAAIEHALYEDRSLVRMLGMRRTMFVVPTELAPVVHAACTRAIAARERRRLEQHLSESAVAPEVNRWLAELEQATFEALVSRGEATAGELAEDLPALRTAIVAGQGSKWEARQYVSTRVLALLAADGRIVRGRPRGSWISGQYRWAPAQAWFTEAAVEWSVEAAQVELARRWLVAFGPGTAADLKWWTGWTSREVKRALAQLEPVEVELGGGETGLLLAEDDEEVVVPAPWVALLPALDPTVMGWSQRAWYLGEHRAALFDRSGNPGPTVWCDGRIVGGWAQRPTGEVAFRLLEDVGAEAAAAVEAAASRLAAWLGEVRVTPRFRTPLERELVA